MMRWCFCVFALIFGLFFTCFFGLLFSLFFLMTGRDWENDEVVFFNESEIVS